MSQFFVFEGLDGSGKTTVINELKKEFPNFLYTREPGGSIFGEKIRNILLDQESKNVPALPFLLAFMSARASHFLEVILPALREGRVVVSDRFDASTFAFQLYGQENNDLEDLFWDLRREILQRGEGVFKLNYIYLKISPEISLERRKVRLAISKEENHFDAQGNSYHERVFRGYEKFFKEINSLSTNPISRLENRVKIVDASLTPDVVYGEVKKIITGLCLK